MKLWHWISHLWESLVSLLCNCVTLLVSFSASLEVWHLDSLNNVLCLSPRCSELLQVIFDLCWRLHHPITAASSLRLRHQPDLEMSKQNRRATRVFTLCVRYGDLRKSDAVKTSLKSVIYLLYDSIFKCSPFRLEMSWYLRLRDLNIFRTYR